MVESEDVDEDVRGRVVFGKKGNRTEANRMTYIAATCGRVTEETKEGSRARLRREEEDGSRQGRKETRARGEIAVGLRGTESSLLHTGSDCRLDCR